MKTNKSGSLFWAVFLIILAILFRTNWHLGENIEFVTTATLLAGSYLGFFYTLLVPFFIMFISDLILGNTSIFIFTWSAYVIIGVVSYFYLGKEKLKNKETKFKTRFIVKTTGLGIIASIFFYLWTNFGVWFLDSFGMYPKTWEGLIKCYVAGIPFLKNNLTGNFLFVPLSFTIAELSRIFLFKIKLVRDKIKLVKFL